MSSFSLRGTEPSLGAARVRLEGDKPVWFVGEAPIAPGAGSGIAAQIVDLVCGDDLAPGGDDDTATTAAASIVAASGSAGGGGRERAIPVDQTHISVIVDERWVVKIVGAWGGADRSAAILERLRLAGSTAAPGFAGALEWQHPERGGGVLALVAEYVPESDDGWTWAVDDVLAYLAGGEGDGRDLESGHLPEWPARVGELTAEMHAALRVAPPSSAEPSPSEPDSDEAKDPRSDDLVNATAVFDRVFESIEGGLDTVILRAAKPVNERSVAESDSAEILRSDLRVQNEKASLSYSTTAGAHGATQDDVITSAGFVTRMLNRKVALAAAILNISIDSTAPLVIPHGDFHVGQLLRTRAGRYFVLDFDGDPQWSAERRLRADGAARDVAHMLVSIDLVAAVVQRRLGSADERAWVWGDAAKQQFLDSYLAASEPGLLDVSALGGLIAEQLLIELSYAEHYLPVWRYAPDGVISRRYSPDFNTGHETDDLAAEQNHTTEQTEPKWNPPASPTT